MILPRIIDKIANYAHYSNVSFSTPGEKSAFCSYFNC